MNLGTSCGGSASTEKPSADPAHYDDVVALDELDRSGSRIGPHHRHRFSRRFARTHGEIKRHEFIARSQHTELWVSPDEASENDKVGTFRHELRAAARRIRCGCCRTPN
jgi:hypothetical protein